MIVLALHVAMCLACVAIGRRARRSVCAVIVVTSAVLCLLPLLGASGFAFGDPWQPGRRPFRVFDGLSPESSLRRTVDAIYGVAEAPLRLPRDSASTRDALDYASFARWCRWDVVTPYSVCVFWGTIWLGTTCGMMFRWCARHARPAGSGG